MTLILGIEDPKNKRAIVCADSCTTIEAEEIINRQLKIHRSNGWILGISGANAIAGVFRTLKLPKPKAETWDSMNATVTRKMMPLLMRHATKVREQYKSWDSNFLDLVNYSGVLARGPYLWRIDVAESASSTSGIVSTGIGGPASSGALHVLLDFIGDRKEALKRAVLGTAHLTGGVRPPFRWLATDGTEGVWAP